MKKSIDDLISEKRQVEALASGSVYKLPTYKVVPEKGIERTARKQMISFVRGSKVVGETEVVPVEGVVHEAVITMLIQDLNQKNEVNPDSHTIAAIQHLAAARDILEDRQRERAQRKILGTYKE